MNKEFIGIAYGWAEEILKGFCDQQGIDWKDDDTLELINVYSESMESNFSDYLESGAPDMDYFPMVGLKTYLTYMRKYDFQRLIDQPYVDDGESHYPAKVVDDVLYWLDNCLGSHGLCYNFSTDYYERSRMLEQEYASNTRE